MEEGKNRLQALFQFEIIFTKPCYRTDYDVDQLCDQAVSLKVR